jgi:hypothetical protein
MTMKKPFGTVMASSLVLAAFSLTPALQSQTAAIVPQNPVVASIDVRSDFATTLERQMRAKGVDAKVQLAGESLEILQVEWTAVHRSNIYSFVTSPAAGQALRMGFETVVFSNGSQRWEYNLRQESMISTPENL